MTVVLLVSAALVGLNSTAATGGTTQAIKIQRGEYAVPYNGTTTLTAPTDFTEFGSLTSAFVLNKNNRFASGGRHVDSGEEQYGDDLSMLIELTDTVEISFTRTSSDSLTYRANWESWEYVGASGGPNEFIVRSWEYIVGTMDGSTQVLYVNGSVGETAAGVEGNIVNTALNSLTIAKQISGDLLYIGGNIDEVRISTTVTRSADWVETEYNNQNNPGIGSGKFIESMDSEETNTAAVSRKDTNWNTGSGDPVGSYTVPSGSNRLLVLVTSWESAGGDRTITGITFGGVAITQA